MNPTKARKLLKQVPKDDMKKGNRLIRSNMKDFPELNNWAMPIMMSVIFALGWDLGNKAKEAELKESHRVDCQRSYDRGQFNGLPK